MKVNLKKGTKLYHNDDPIVLLEDAEVDFTTHPEIGGVAEALATDSFNYMLNRDVLVHTEKVMRPAKPEDKDQTPKEVSIEVSYGLNGAREENAKALAATASRAPVPLVPTPSVPFNVPSSIPPQPPFKVPAPAVKPATIAAVNGLTQVAPISSAFPIHFEVTVKSADGKGIQGQLVTFNAPASGPSGTFVGGSHSAEVSTDVAGVATAPAFTANDQSGAYTVMANTVPALSPAVSFSLTNSEGA